MIEKLKGDNVPSEKSFRSSVAKQEINYIQRRKISTLIKKFRNLAETKGSDLSQVLAETIIGIDKAANKGIFHPNKAARLKSRLSNLAKKSSSS